MSPINRIKKSFAKPKKPRPANYRSPRWLTMESLESRSMLSAVTSGEAVAAESDSVQPASLLLPYFEVEIVAPDVGPGGDSCEPPPHYDPDDPSTHTCEPPGADGAPETDLNQRIVDRAVEDQLLRGLRTAPRSSLWATNGVPTRGADNLTIGSQGEINDDGPACYPEDGVCTPPPAYGGMCTPESAVCVPVSIPVFTSPNDSNSDGGSQNRAETLIGERPDTIPESSPRPVEELSTSDLTTAGQAARFASGNTNAGENYVFLSAAYGAAGDSPDQQIHVKGVNWQQLGSHYAIDSSEIPTEQLIAQSKAAEMADHDEVFTAIGADGGGNIDPEIVDDIYIIDFGVPFP